MSRTPGQRIADARAKLSRDRGEKLTQQWLADQVEVSKGTVAKWETDVQIPSEGNLDSLARALKVARSELAAPDVVRETEPEYAVGDEGRTGNGALARQLDRLYSMEMDEDVRAWQLSELTALYRAEAMGRDAAASQDFARAMKARARAALAAELNARTRAGALRGAVTRLSVDDFQRVQATSEGTVPPEGST